MSPFVIQCILLVLDNYKSLTTSTQTIERDTIPSRTITESVEQTQFCSNSATVCAKQNPNS